jgi:hypothetical protein
LLSSKQLKMNTLALTLSVCVLCFLGNAQSSYQNPTLEITSPMSPTNGGNDNFGGCGAGVFPAPLNIDVCPNNFVTAVPTGASVPGSPGYGFNFVPQTGGTGGVPGGFSISAFDAAFLIFDSNLNGTLTNAGYTPMLGLWEIQGYAFTNPTDPSSSICEFTSNSLLVNFLSAGPLCTGCEAGELVDDSFQIVPAGQSASVYVDDLFIPTGGGYAYSFSEGIDGSGGLTDGFNIINSSYQYIFDADLNGLMSGNSLPPLSGAWVVFGFAYSDPADIAASVCDVTSQAVIVYFDNSFLCPTILNGSANYLPYDPIFESVIASNPDCCDIAWDGNCEAFY